MLHRGILINYFRRGLKSVEVFVDDKEFSYYRKRLSKTQKQMAQLLGTSLKAIHSYEQGWRSVPANVERQVFFLVTHMRGTGKGRKSCWVIKKCHAERKKECPAWEFQAGKICWFINGTICDGEAKESWKEKMQLCRSCEVFTSALKS